MRFGRRLLATGIVLVFAGCTFGDLANYPIGAVAGADGGNASTDGAIGATTNPTGMDGGTVDGGGESVGDSGATSCAVADSTPVAIGAGLPCSESETGTPIVFPLPNDPRGICHFGTKTCTSAGTFDVCRNAVGPLTRDCTSADDNDCDGLADSSECTGCLRDDATQAKIGESVSCFDFPAPAKANTGVCVAGLKGCGVDPNDHSKLAWGPCANEKGPTSTDPTKDLTCNATSDENCNGTPQEGCTCTNGGTKTCGDCKKTSVTCTAGAWGSCPASSASTWNGINVGSSCSVGTGACNRVGSVVCPANDGDAVCNVSAGSPGNRNCGGSGDNDCNGAIDTTESVCKCDGVTNPGTTRNCPANQCGTQTCQAPNGSTSASWSACAGPHYADHGLATQITFTDQTAQNSNVGGYVFPGNTSLSPVYTLTFNLNQQGNVDNTHAASDSSGPALEVGCNNHSTVFYYGSEDFGHSGPGGTFSITCSSTQGIYFEKRTNWGGGCCGGYTRTITITNVNYAQCN